VAVSNRFGWGVVGAGRRARETMIPALLELPRSKLIAVCAADEERARQSLSTWPELKIYSQLDEFLADPKMQVIYIASPHFLHVPQAVSVIESGKHIFMESPLALSVDGAHKLIEKARTRGVKLGLAFQFRFHSAMRDLREKIQAGELGEVRYLSVNYAERMEWPSNWWSDAMRSGPAAVLRFAVHALDLASWLHPHPVAEVMAAGEDDPDTNINSQALVLLRFQGGGLGCALGSAAVASRDHSIRVDGSRGSVSLEGDFRGQGPMFWREVREGKETTREYKPEDPIGRMLKEFNKAVQEGAEFSPEGKDGKKIVEITCAVIESMRNKRSVKVGEVLRQT